jgi:hypothetical protein
VPKVDACITDIICTFSSLTCDSLGGWSFSSEKEKIHAPLLLPEHPKYQSGTSASTCTAAFRNTKTFPNTPALNPHTPSTVHWPQDGTAVLELQSPLPLLVSFFVSLFHSCIKIKMVLKNCHQQLPWLQG